MARRRHKPGTKSIESIYRAFRKAVNMTQAEIEAWLDTDESKSVGFVRSGETESVGRQSAKRIIRILHAGGPTTDSDISHMQKVVGYVARHLAQKPARDVRHTRWRYSLMNWGHDPLEIGAL